MAIVKIVTDSTADVPKHMIEDLGITVVPLKVHFGKETFTDGVTITSEEFYQKLEGAEQLPTTSQPSPVDFVETYKKLQSEAEEEVHILSIHISAALSGTVQSALLAQNMLEEKVDITVIDSKQGSYGIGMIVVEAAEAAKAGKSKEECMARIHQLIKTTKTYFLVDTLHYLQKGGRIGKASAVLGSLLNIKPILSLDENGEVYAMDKVRGNKKALAKIFSIIKGYVGTDEIRVGISHSTSDSEAVETLTLLKEHFKVKSDVMTKIGPVIGTHVGPKTIGIIMSKE